MLRDRASLIDRLRDQETGVHVLAVFYKEQTRATIVSDCAVSSKKTGFHKPLVALIVSTYLLVISLVDRCVSDAACLDSGQC